MQVYKAYFKIILKNLNQIIIYIAVFLSITVSLTKLNTTSNYNGFVEKKVDIAFINNDEDSWLVEGLKNHLLKHSNIISLEDEERKLQDALFFRKVEYIVRIPDGFSGKFISGNEAQIEKSTIPNSPSQIYIDMLINNYLNTARAYIAYTDKITGEQILSRIDNDLSQSTEVNMARSLNSIILNGQQSFFFNYMAYALFSILILGVSSVMIVFNKNDLKMRNLCSPLKLKSMNLQMIMGNLSFAVITWLIMIIAGFILFGSFMISTNGLLYMLNSFIFTFAALSISYLIGNIIRSKNAMSAAANVVALGSCFLSGVMVPQEYMSEAVLKVSSFNPTYWFVTNNNIIAESTVISTEKLSTLFGNMLIIVGFTVAILSVTLLVIRQRRLND